MLIRMEWLENVDTFFSLSENGSREFFTRNLVRWNNHAKDISNEIILRSLFVKSVWVAICFIQVFGMAICFIDDLFQRLQCIELSNNLHMASRMPESTNSKYKILKQKCDASYAQRCCSVFAKIDLWKVDQKSKRFDKIKMFTFGLVNYFIWNSFILKGWISRLGVNYSLKCIFFDDFSYDDDDDDVYNVSHWRTAPIPLFSERVKWKKKTNDNVNPVVSCAKSSKFQQ